MTKWLALCPFCYSKSWKVVDYLEEQMRWTLACMECLWVGFANELAYENSLPALPE